MKKHLQEQVDLYGKQTMVNLVNHKGYEKPIKEAFEKYVTEVCHFQPAKFRPYSMQFVIRSNYLIIDMNTLISIQSVRTCAGIESAF